jgi:tetratricopeptide (TPR) repeat protein
MEKELYKLLQSKVVEPSIISLVWSLKNQRLIRQGLYAEAYNSCLCLVHYNKTHGFTKQNLIQEYLNLAKIYKLTGERGKALLQIQKCIENSKTKDPELYIHSLIEKALILTEFNNAYDGLSALMGKKT